MTDGLAYREMLEYEEQILSVEMSLERHKSFLRAQGYEERPFASCCAEGGGSVEGCDCVNKAHGFAFVSVKN